ncbi:cutinase family protein [Nocardia puris]|uniref:cutinase family protein n=1 Tax=Nocardia puris TaxID=208602 RepID=UPI002B4ACD10|nr:cutinase family protein [Nocardia puris]
MSPRRRVRRTVSAALAAASVTTAVYGTASTAAQAAPGCAVLAVIGVQGTGQSSPGADPTADTGVVGALLGPVVAAAPDLVSRTYIGYQAGFGGVVPGGGPAPYAESVAEAAGGVRAALADIAARCPQTRFAGVGYSQGAQAWSEVAREIGASRGPVPADRIAGIALYSSPDRAPGSPVIPGRPGQTTPDPAPGTTGAAVAGVTIGSAPAGGSGIASSAADYGALTGRVVDICVEGDLACSAPDRALALRLGAQLIAQADLTNPVAALGTIGSLLSAALGEAWTTVLLNDFHLGPAGVDYVPGVPLSRRLLDAADPRIPAPSAHEHDVAGARWGEIVAVIGADPLARVPRLAGQLAAAWTQLAADNADLLNPAVWLRFADLVARHNNYAATGQLTSGTQWLIALAHDLGTQR